SSYHYAAPLFAVEPYYRAEYEIGLEVDKMIPSDALLVVGDIDDNADATYRTQAPMLLCYCQRKGWQLLPPELQDRARLDDLIARGARYLLVPTRISWDTHQATLSMILYEAKTSKEIARYDKHYER